MRKKLFISTLFLIFQISFGQNEFQGHLVTDTYMTINTIQVFDLDHDGDLDLLVTNTDANKVMWFENLDGLGTFSEEIIIDDELISPQSAYAADIDADGDLDVIADSFIGPPSGSVVYWFENLDGQANFGVAQNTTIETYLSSLFGDDIDNDGDADIFTRNDNRVSWFENLNRGETFDNDLNQIYYAGNEPVFFSSNIFFSDINSDNHTDILIARYYGDDILYKTLGENGVNGGGVVGGMFAAGPMYSNDLDNDGDIDIIAGTEGVYETNQLIWFENTDGLGNFANGQEIPIVTGVRSVFSEDINGDGYNDILATTSDEGGIIKWYKNLNGTGNFAEEQIVAYLEGVSKIIAADVNNDGNQDIIVNTESGTIVWYENIDNFNNFFAGTVVFSQVGSNCNTQNNAISNIIITASSDDYSFSTFSRLDGSFVLEANQNLFTCEIESSLPDYYDFIPEYFSYDFSGFENTVVESNFCITSNQEINDLDISVYSINSPRPGFDNKYQIVYNNKGTTVLNGSISFEYDDSKMNFLNASETISSETFNLLTFDFEGLNPFEIRTINLEFNVFPPPTTEIDDIITTTTTINPISSDITEEDNVYELHQTVIGSYDPNDITCLEGDQILINDIDKYLHYLIRFQNTGNAEAINVEIEHILDEKLDWSTMRLESHSNHSMQTLIKDESKITFYFSNIYLPDSTHDEPNSHGFVAFKIKPKQDVEVSDVFNAKANIYFDFNPAIVTNTASTVVVEALSTSEFDKTEDILIYPNPASETVSVKSNNIIDSVSLMDINGRTLKKVIFDLPKTSHEIDVSRFSKGVYFIQINFRDKSITKKIIKY